MTTRKKATAKKTTRSPRKAATSARARTASNGRATKRKPASTKRTMDAGAALAKFKGSWKKSRTFKREGGSFVADIPSGTFCAQLNEAKVALPKSGGDPYVRFGFLVIEGEYEGTKLSTMLSVSDRIIDESKGTSALDILSDTLQKLGIDTAAMEDPSELPEICRFLLDEQENEEAKPVVSVYVSNKTDKSGKPRQNVYINERLNEDQIANWEDRIAEE